MAELLLYHIKHHLSIEYRVSCADLEGGSGDLEKLNIVDITGNEKISYFSYLCYEFFLTESRTLPGKIFWIRAWVSSLLPPTAILSTY